MVEHGWVKGILNSVSWLRKSGVLVLVLWGLAMSHCALERLPGLGFLACCQHGGIAPHQDSDCDMDGCSAVESGLYKLEEPVSASPSPLLAGWVLPFEATAPRNRPLCSAIVDSSPPERQRVWQFSQRTALPPRAPSSAS